MRFTIDSALAALRNPNASTQLRNDAAAFFIAEQVQSISPSIVETVFSAPEWELHVPMEPGLPEGALEVGFDIFAPAGQAETFTGSGQSLPVVGAVVERITRKVDDIGIKREISDAQLAAAALDVQLRRQQLGTDNYVALDQALERAAAQAVFQYHESLVISGRPAVGILGVTNQTGMPEYVPPNGGNGSPLWENKTGEEIVADLTGLLNACINSAKLKQYWPNHIALPLNKYLIASDGSKKMAYTNDTPLAFFQKNNILGTALKIESWQRLNEQGTGSSGFALCYKMDPDVISYAAPVIHQINTPPKREVAGWQWAHTGRSAGVLLRRPFAVSKMQGF